MPYDPLFETPHPHHRTSRDWRVSAVNPNPDQTVEIEMNAALTTSERIIAPLERIGGELEAIARSIDKLDPRRDVLFELAWDIKQVAWRGTPLSAGI